uniref:Uncharacterized protein n=1 Tax=Castor canadensis TaxID=51338 RepID=A0A8C0WU93_CASCN
MNWHVIISGLIVVVLKVVGMTLFLLYFSQIFGLSNDSFTPTRSYGTGKVHHFNCSPPRWRAVSIYTNLVYISTEILQTFFIASFLFSTKET